MIFNKLWLRLVALCLCASAVILAIPTVNAEIARSASQPQRGYTYATVVHEYRSFSSAVIGQLEDGTTVQILDETGKLYKIDCYDMVGYVDKEQLAQRDDGSYYVSCREESDQTVVMYYHTADEALFLRHSLVALGKCYMGVPYRLGGMSPRAFDCSGFTKYLYDKYDIDLTRRASTQLADGIIVSKESLQVGDLIFLKFPGETCQASHVGVYVGNNQILHASSSRGIALNDLSSDYYTRYYLCARRIVCTDPTRVLPESSEPSIFHRTGLGLRSIP